MDVRTVDHSYSQGVFDFAGQRVVFADVIVYHLADFVVYVKHRICVQRACSSADYCLGIHTLVLKRDFHCLCRVYAYSFFGK